MTTKATPNLSIGNIANVCVWASADDVMKSPKRCDYANNAEPRFGSKGCICHAILNEGETLFQSTANIYIYIYIYIWKANKGVAKIKFC